MAILGVPLVLFIFSFITVPTGYYWTITFWPYINVIWFVAFLLLDLETRHVPGQVTVKISRYFTFCRMEPTLIEIVAFIAPLSCRST
ncbi:hypothetical protein LB505_014173 [Fusarium chuoi]|nr:hypothetical protein LB505_014173 [Fusarium chuoi]